MRIIIIDDPVKDKKKVSPEEANAWYLSLGLEHVPAMPWHDYDLYLKIGKANV